MASRKKKTRKKKAIIRLHGEYFASRGCTHVWSPQSGSVDCAHSIQCWACSLCGVGIRWHGQAECRNALSMATQGVGD